MKKVILVLLVGLLWCNVGFAAKNKIVIDRCYNPSKYQNYNSFYNSPDANFEEWGFEIDLKNNKAVRISQFKGQTEVELFPHEIDVATTKFIRIIEKYNRSVAYTINLNTGDLQIETTYGDGTPSFMKCEKF